MSITYLREGGVPPSRKRKNVSAVKMNPASMIKRNQHWSKLDPCWCACVWVLPGVIVLEDFIADGGRSTT
jgi:hypothetical protein